jgi:membrane fusion protein (multidrug efflux system)
MADSPKRLRLMGFRRFSGRSCGIGRSLIAGLALACFGVACGRGDAAPAESSGPRPVTAEVVTVTPELLRDEVSFVGQLEAAASVTIRAEAEGIIERVGFEEGSVVEEGQILFALRNDEPRARLRLAEAELAKVDAEYGRTAKLAQRNAASAAALERQAAEREIARAAVALARVQLEKTYVRAPFTGYSGQRLVWVGDRVDEQRDLVRLDDISRVVLFFSLPELALPLARPGVPLRVRVAPYPEESFDGEVFFVSPYLEVATRRLSVKAWIPNPDHKLRPGLFAEVEAVIDERPEALVLPEAAIVYDRDGAFVWRLDPGNRASLRTQGRVEVTAGLSPGDRVVAAGTNKVFDGSVVLEAAEHTADRSVADPGPAAGDGSGT